jgi:hypothetical protein
LEHRSLVDRGGGAARLDELPDDLSAELFALQLTAFALGGQC